MPIKKYALVVLIFFSCLFDVSAQKMGFTYQAVAIDQSKAESFGRDSQGEILANRNIILRFTLMEGSEDGAMVYQETHNTTTDIFGIFRLIVGRGDILFGNNLEDLQWGEIPYFLQVEIDLGEGLVIMGIEELLGSPYALNSNIQLLELNGSALSISKGNTINLEDIDATNELVQNAVLNGTLLEISDAGGTTTVDLGTLASTDNSITNELQTITKTGSTVTLSNSGGSFTDEVNDADFDATNEIQNISTDGTAGNLSLSSGATLGLNVDDADASVTNEIQDLQLVGNNLTITNNSSATTIDLSTTNTQLTEAQVDGYVSNNGFLSTEVDGSITNEIQDISSTGAAGNITLSSGSTLALNVDDADASVTNEIQDLQLVGNNLTITNNSSATTIDLSTTNTQLTEAQVDGYVSNNGFLTTEVDGSITNEIQDISSTGAAGNITLSSGSTLALNVDDADASVTNEIQDLNLTGDDLTITNNGAATTIDLSGYMDDTNTQLTEAQVDAYVSNNSYLTSFTEVDGSVTNEIQDLNLTGNDLTITNNSSATTIDLSKYNAFATASNITSNSPGNIATDNFVFGSTSLDNIAGTDDDNRMFFDKSKGAFRVGSVGGTQWDDANVGDYSFAAGQTTIASGDGSFASGLGSTASNLGSFASGEATASGPYSFASGLQTTASDVGSFASGWLASASGIYSFASGFQATASGQYSFASGGGNALGGFSFASGTSTASGEASFTSGYQNTASGAASFATGMGTIAPSYTETVLGAYNTDYTPTSTTAFNSSDRLFVIGNGIGTPTIIRSDALIMLKSGDATLNGELTIDADNIGGSDGYTLPGQDGANGQVMTTDGSGTVIWSAASTQLTEVQVDAYADDNGYLKTEVDGSTTNEIQNLSSVLNEGTDANNNRISNLADPVNAKDVVNLQYLEAKEANDYAINVSLSEYFPGITGTRSFGFTGASLDKGSLISVSGNNSIIITEAGVYAMSVQGFTDVAVGDDLNIVINNVQITPVLRSANIYMGTYLFDLSVSDFIHLSYVDIPTGTGETVKLQISFHKI